MGTKDKLLSVIADHCDTNSDKVTVVGTGDVGMACVVSILTQGISSDVTMIDLNENKMMGELLDLQHGCMFLNAKVSACQGNDYAGTAGSKVCIVTAGVRQKEGESRLDLVQRNTDVLKMIIPNLAKYSPDTIMIVVSNPCDILAYVTWKLSGLPKNKIIGSGTNLDSSRLRFYISEKMGVAPESVHGWVIGEHGDSSGIHADKLTFIYQDDGDIVGMDTCLNKDEAKVTVWSGVNVGGVRLKDLNPAIGTDNDPENWKGLQKLVIQSAADVIKLKGFTNWAIGLSIANLTRSILRNSRKIHPVSTYIKGMCGIEHEVFLSLPCTLGSNGVTSIIDPNLSEEERCYLKFSAAKMVEITSGIKF